MKKFYFLLLTNLLFVGCGNNTETIQPVSKQTENTPSTGIFSNSDPINKETTKPNNDHHHVVVNEILETTKYSYCLVSENKKQFWIATIKMPFKIGKEYVYNGGLLKTNFKSVEHNRVFDTLYLVSDIAPSSHQHTEIKEPSRRNTSTNTTTTKGKKPENAITIKNILNNAEKYANQEVVIYGEVTKVNANIMNRNWLHVKDGTANDYDFVITSNSVVPVGHILAFKGTVHTNVDFGAGYSYEIIIENAVAL